MPPRVLIVGGGFAGLEAAKALAHLDADVRLIDQRNHHVFQPLLYQVATAAISPADIASPIRHVLRRQKNLHVVLATVTGVDLPRRRLHFATSERPDHSHPEGFIEYDYLILAAGATHSYFGKDDWAKLAPGLKSIEDATEIRRRILLAFENAEYEGSDDRRRAALTFAIVGGGPTGVELAGAIKEIAAATIPADFRNIDTKTTRVLLLEGGPRLLPAMPDSLSARAKRDLEHMGVEVRLGKHVTNITPDGVWLGDEFVPVRNVLWAAGVQASPIAKTLGVPLDKAGRVIVGPDLTVPDHPNVFVVGDMAAAKSADTGTQVPGVAQGGLQMGKYAGQAVAAAIRAAGAAPPARKPFVYRDLGSMATIGKARAVADIMGFKLAGFPAWAIWGAIHVMSIVNFRSRLSVAAQWFWNWLLFSRDARLITGKATLDVAMPRDDAGVGFAPPPPAPRS
ncbi:MAG: NAD(P)/FAD-dependent oxidoreductase [Tepidisphaera sp.]|nr:NAD(P)/FAD-dependent oxidoreductase [Tepidisphaera sp.]